MYPTIIIYRYGYEKEDFFIVCANFHGLALSFYYMSSCLNVMSYSVAVKEMKNQEKRDEQLDMQIAKTHKNIYLITTTMPSVALFWGTIGLIGFVALGPKYSPNLQVSVVEKKLTAGRFFVVISAKLWLADSLSVLSNGVRSISHISFMNIIEDNYHTHMAHLMQIRGKISLVTP